jgi:phage shock protein A
MNSPHCSSCGVAIRSHVGLIDACRELTAARLEIQDLRAELNALRREAEELRALVAQLTSAIEAAPGVVDLQDVLDSANQSDAEATERLQSMMDAWADKHL